MSAKIIRIQKFDKLRPTRLAAATLSIHEFSRICAFVDFKYGRGKESTYRYKHGDGGEVHTVAGVTNAVKFDVLLVERTETVLKVTMRIAKAGILLLDASELMKKAA